MFQNVEAAIISTYRCNAQCKMCNIWQHPTKKADEFRPEILEKLPNGLRAINITGGEAMLRDDIDDIVRILIAKTRRLEISTNGYFTDRILRVCDKFPNITVRVSIEGLPKLNDELRGLRDGFDHALRTVLRLKQAGIRDVGFGIVISDRNCGGLLDVYALCARLGVEFGNAVMHNSFYFHKHDNRIENLDVVTQEMKRFIRALLSSRRNDWRLRIKDWGRAYLNLGLLRYMHGKTRALRCTAASDLFFVSPIGEVLACNGSAEPWILGDLNEQSFEDVWKSEQANQVRSRVATCTRNCWMTGTARPAMRRNLRPVLQWILTSKVRLRLGREIVVN